MKAPLSELLESILGGRGLTFDQAREIAGSMLRGELDDVSIAALLVALRARGERAEVVAGFASSLRESCLRVDTEGLDPIDTAGTGGDGAHTINASTAAAIVAASLGVKVLKHGNRGVSSRSGSADFIEALGYPINHGPREASCILARAGFAFLFAPAYHPAMKRVMPVRRRLGIRTVFNLVGPLANPGMVKRQVLGVASASLAPVMAEAGSLLGYEKLLIVHGEPGIDEVSVSGDTIFYEAGKGGVERYKLSPRDLGVARTYPLSELRVESPSESVERFLRTARGEGREADAAFIAVNAAAALYVAGAVKDLRDGVETALQALRDGVVYDFIERLREVARRCMGG